MAQSCLEKIGIEQRHISQARSEYTRGDNEYSETHPNALATGDARGKGTGGGGMSFWLPDCSSFITAGLVSQFRFDDFDTALESNPGNSTDQEARRTSLARSMYNGETQYSAQLIDTSANVREGQYVMI